MKTTLKLSRFILLIFCTICVNILNAATVTQSFSGTINDVLGSSRLFNDSVVVGTGFSGSVTVEDAIDHDPSRNVGSYAIIEWDVQFGDYYVKYTASPIFHELEYRVFGFAPRDPSLESSISVMSNSSNSPGTYQTETSDPVQQIIGFEFVEYNIIPFDIGLRSSFSDAVIGNQFPMGAIDLSLFDLENSFRFYGLMTGFEANGPFIGGFFGTFNQIQTVPVPPALGLFAFGLLGLFGVARRRITHQK